ncbi:MAG: hypothetical protein CM1200mP9_00310 [Gammaproteobacteria bacterium]|nr:MAG: hypothetical protein CM1200mP9_00310 [Gammaproteobacteria bacterium]
MNRKNIVRRFNVWRETQAIRPELASETLELFKDACKPLGADAEYVTFIEHAIDDHPDVRLVDELANLKADQDGSKSAMKFLGTELATDRHFWI